MQFMKICTERPEQLPSLEAIGMADADGSSYTPVGGQSGPGRGGFKAGGGLSRAPSGPGPAQGRMGNARTASPGFAPMGTFAPPKTSSERFAQSTAAQQGGFGSMTGRPSTVRNASMPAMGMSRPKSNMGKQRRGPPPPPEAGPLATTENAWTPGQPKILDPNSPELVQRKVKALLNKLTMEKFDSISDQILEWANKSEQESDGRILRQVIALVFEKATDEAAWSSMYALLCRKVKSCT